MRAWQATVILSLVVVSSAFGDVIFSRRIYKEHGASYQQIWTWDPADGVLKQLTRSLRDHEHPTCDGRMVKFTDGTNLWSLNPVTGEERMMGPAAQPNTNQVRRSGAVINLRKPENSKPAVTQTR